MKFKRRLSTVLVVMLYCIAETFQQTFQEIPVADFCTELPKTFENSTIDDLLKFQQTLRRYLENLSQKINGIQPQSTTPTTPGVLSTSAITTSSILFSSSPTTSASIINSTTLHEISTISATAAAGAAATAAAAGTQPSATSMHTDTTFATQNPPDATTPSLDKLLMMKRKIPSENGTGAGMIGILAGTHPCLKLTQEELIEALKDKGTYNPDYMAWDVDGVQHFFRIRASDGYDKRDMRSHEEITMFTKNIEAVEKMIGELDLHNCEVDAEKLKFKLYNITSDLRRQYYVYNTTSKTRRHRRDAINKIIASHQINYLYSRLNSATAETAESRDQTQTSAQAKPKDAERNTSIKESDEIGTVHIYDCEERGSEQDGYLRLCGSCRAVRVMPTKFFPPFINENVCSEDASCMYFYEYPHGKCRQKHLNFVVLENIGTDECQLWRRYNLNVRVCCECFVDRMSFFAKYV